MLGIVGRNTYVSKRHCELFKSAAEPLTLKLTTPSTVITSPDFHPARSTESTSTMTATRTPMSRSPSPSPTTARKPGPSTTPLAPRPASPGRSARCSPRRCRSASTGWPSPSRPAGSGCSPGAQRPVLRRYQRRPARIRLTRHDDFADNNILSIALELPNDMLGADPATGIWASISLRRDDTLTQMDRGGNPSRGNRKPVNADGGGRTDEHRRCGLARSTSREQARAAQRTEEWKQRYAVRAGIEGTIHQATATTGLRRSGYLGLAKTHLAHVITATAINLIRLDAWWTATPPAAHGPAIWPHSAPPSPHNRNEQELGNRVLQGRPCLGRWVPASMLECLAASEAADFVREVLHLGTHRGEVVAELDQTIQNLAQFRFDLDMIWVTGK